MKFIHDHKQELRSSNEVLADLQESGRSEVYEERKVTNSFKETWAGPLNLTPRKASLLTRRIIPTSEKKWEALHAHSPDGGHLAASVSKMVTTMLRHFDQEERQIDGSRHWDSTNPVLMRAFAHEGAQDFSDKICLRLIHEGSTKKRLEYCTDKDGNIYYFRAIQRHSGGIPISPELMKCSPVPYTWNGAHLPQRKFVDFSIYLGKWNNSRRNGEGQRSTGSLSNATESFWKTPRGGKSLILIAQFLKKYLEKLVGNTSKMQYIGYGYRKRRIKDCISGNRSHLQSWLTPQYQETALTV